ncbi:uncharacterized protein LOC132305324 [Cornus florida]|uniref:uncharacterized protein LOC132305324 n=1 Tax=Cornus florida TaxID=4283 RepID=UPI002897EFA2|nr:uncharacterized protein LOC132305324 [Cornus florida]
MHVSILSLMGTRESARTCVLSKRWERLWSYNILNFDALETIFEIELNPEVLGVERSKYISWVNKAVESHRGSTIDEFRVSFCFNVTSSCVIDRWIEFAIAKRVQRLELGLNQCPNYEQAEAYTFPNQSYIYIKSPAGLSSIRPLRSLCFKRVNISGEILEYLLSNCPILESLQDLEVCATGLVSFKYFGLGRRIDMQIKDAFQLAEVSISDFVERIDTVFFSLSSYFSQLETLSLAMNLACWKMGNAGFQLLPEFTKLKHLTLQVVADDFASLLGLTTLINASPLLHKFKLQLSIALIRERSRKVELSLSSSAVAARLRLDMWLQWW